MISLKGGETETVGRREGTGEEGVWNHIKPSRLGIYVGITYLFLIALAEILTVEDARIGITAHIFILFATLIHSTLTSDRNLSAFIMSLVLAPLIRILSISMPLTHFSRISWFMLISIPIFIATFTCIYLQGIKLGDVGFSKPILRNIPLECGVIPLAVPLGFAEYLILKPEPLPHHSFISASLILIICTGLVEELTFRGLLQYNATRVMSKWSGILLISAIFAVLHIGNLSILDCIFAFFIGFLFSIVRERTRTIYGISISHGLINIILFLVAPLMQ